MDKQLKTASAIAYLDAFSVQAVDLGVRGAKHGA